LRWRVFLWASSGRPDEQVLKSTLQSNIVTRFI